MNGESRYRLVSHVTTAFWKKWSDMVTPNLVRRQKWHEKAERELRVGDIVLICDKGKMKGKYKMGVVDSIGVGRDGHVRNAVIRYNIPRNMQNIPELYEGNREVKVHRSVQKLSLVLPVEEQEKPLSVNLWEVGVDVVEEDPQAARLREEEKEKLKPREEGRVKKTPAKLLEEKKDADLKKRRFKEVWSVAKKKET